MKSFLILMLGASMVAAKHPPIPETLDLTYWTNNACNSTKSATITLTKGKCEDLDFKTKSWRVTGKNQKPEGHHCEIYGYPSKGCEGDYTLNAEFATDPETCFNCGTQGTSTGKTIYFSSQSFKYHCPFDYGGPH